LKDASQCKQLNFDSNLIFSGRSEFLLQKQMTVRCMSSIWQLNEHMTIQCLL